ncbi:MAG: AAA family ATPase [Piscinibacter sp.]|nr:AAA family ATPase [Piscinibacter sp.]
MKPNRREPLSNRLAAGPLSIADVLSIGTQLAAALADRHGRGLLHLRLSPQTAGWEPATRQATLAGPALADAAPALAYMAPEQSGRIEQQPDARSDLYALGVLLYELLTGAPPFQSDDPLAQIHWHLAGVAEPPLQRRRDVPPTLSDLVLKLLAKSPEERYPSASSLRHDLEACARAWAASGRIEPFVLGQRGQGAMLVAPARLVGRERELHCLLQSFGRACAGQRTLVLVEGWSGIGKTALIRQLAGPIARHQGHFIAGKFDQVVRGVPFGGLIQAFRALVRQLLGHSEAQLAAWREALARALGENGGVLAEVIPEIEFIVGAQPAPVALAGIEAQNRFQRVLQNFVAALAQPAHPLVLFLDDLQWADAATLSLLEPLLADDAVGSLMLLGAYRDNELDASPRLAHTLAALAAASVPMQRLALGPLTPEDLVGLVADTLYLDAAAAAPLAQLVHQKTGGNPFFAGRFLHMLVRDGLLRFDEDAGAWRWQLDAIAAAPLAENVVELMARSIGRLGPRGQGALTLAACIGNRFDVPTLALVSEQPRAEIEEALHEAAAEGLIVASRGATGDPVYAFLHDRVQQAAYALIPEERRETVHLSVGRLLRARGADVADAAGLFDILHHLNLGRARIEAPAERHAVAALNLAGGRRAKSSAAHESALELFRCGLDLLDGSAWSDDYPLAFALHLEAADSLMVCGRLDAAQAALAELLPHARDAVDRAQVVRLRSLAHEAAEHYADALASAREGLRPLGVDLPEAVAAQESALGQETTAIETLRAGRPIATLVDLPATQDPAVRVVMAMLTDVWSAAYIVGEATLARLISATLVRLSLQHGNAEESAYGYVTHAITVGALRGQYREAHEFGRLALAVNARFDDRRRRAKIYQQFHAHVNFWCEPLRSCMAYAREACRAGLDGGDFIYAAYAAGTEAWSGVFAAQDLAQFVRETEPAVALIERLKNHAFADGVRVLLAWARALQGRTEAPLSMTDAGFDEAAWLERYGGVGFFTAIHAVGRLQLGVLLGTPAQALQAAQQSARLIGHLPGTVWPIAHEFWHAMALVRACDEATLTERGMWLGEVQQAQRTFAQRSLHCAENFRAQALLLAAEVARLDGHGAEAAELGEQALEFAAAHPLVAFEALAHERLALLQGGRDRPRTARLHLEAAREAYGRWGAASKVQALERQFPVLAELAPPAASRPADPAHAPAGTGDELDFVSVLKAAQAIAAQTEVDALLGRLMEIALENAGADRGVLVLESEAGPQAHVAGLSVAAGPGGRPLQACEDVPAALVHFVRRTREAVVLADAAGDELHGTDPYVRAHRPRSLLALPLQQQGRLLGVLVLENRLVAGAFSPARVRTVGVLAAQAAIALENARLLARIEAENSALRRDLIANVSHDLRTPLVSLRGYLELLSAKEGTLPDDQRAQYLGIAVRQSERLGTLIDELFELAKLDFKGMALQRERFALAELAADVAQKFQLEAQTREVELRVCAGTRLAFVEADVGLMERVFENLVGNALRHTPAGGRIELRIVQDAQGLMVEVADTGRGIDASELPFIFDRFWRGGGGRRGDGAGLGLAITRRILELHGSSIRADSDGHSGSCFSFRLREV